MHITPYKQTTENNIKGWRDGSVVEGIVCSCRGPRFNSYCPYGSSQSSVTSVPGDLTIFSPPQVLHADGTQTHMMAKHLYPLKKLNNNTVKEIVSMTSEVIVLRIYLVGDRFFTGSLSLSKLSPPQPTMNLLREQGY